MASPELREMQEQWRDEEDERSSSAREMPGPSNAGPSNPAPISIPVSAISQDLIWGNLVQNNFSLETSLQYPTLREKAPYNPEECLIDFLNEKEELTPEWDPVKKDERNLALLKDLIKDSFTFRYPATSGTAFPETTKTDSETAVERGLLLLIYGVLLSLAKPYIPLSEGSCSRKKKASLPNQSDQSPGKNVASPDLKMLLGEGGKRAKRGVRRRQDGRSGRSTNETESRSGLQLDLVIARVFSSFVRQRRRAIYLVATGSATLGSPYGATHRSLRSSESHCSGPRIPMSEDTLPGCSLLTGLVILVIECSAQQFKGTGEVSGSALVE
ncbi:hypothetical protein L1987_88441 [Smallanthus sonchifolius]|nr:hypothetical protein L1987_88441 [Smallanthus sonchifolius]